MGRASRMDLRLSDGGCGDRLPYAQPWMALRLLHHQAWRLPWLSSDQSHRSAPPSAPMGNRFRRDFLLKKQRLASIETLENFATSRLPQRRHLSLHFHLPHRLLLPPGALTFLWPVHCPDAQCHLLDLPSHHHCLFNLLSHFGSQMVWHWLGRVVEKWTVLAHFR